MPKFHAVFIVSKKPINLSSFKSDEGVVQHYIHEEFELKSNNTGSGGWLIKHNASKYSKHPLIMEAIGSTVSNVIVNWLKNLVHSFSYEPAYRKH